MLKTYRLLLFSILSLLIVFSGSSTPIQTGSQKQLAENLATNKCKTLGNRTVNIPENLRDNVKLNGSTVEQVDCTSIEDYSFVSGDEDRRQMEKTDKGVFQIIISSLETFLKLITPL